MNSGVNLAFPFQICMAQVDELTGLCGNVKNVERWKWSLKISLFENLKVVIPRRVSPLAKDSPDEEPCAFFVFSLFVPTV